MVRASTWRSGYFCDNRQDRSDFHEWSIIFLVGGSSCMCEGVPIHPSDFLGGGESMWELSHIAHEVDNLFDVVVSEEVVG